MLDSGANISHPAERWGWRAKGAKEKDGADLLRAGESEGSREEGQEEEPLQSRCCEPDS